MSKYFPSSQLIINSDGSVFHLHLRAEQLADKVILVGDQNRVDLVASYFDLIECEVQNREFHTITGYYKGKRISCISTGIGTDNCDIVMNELDALVNIDFATRMERSERKSLEIVRVGTCGSLQDDIGLGSYLVSDKSIGFDGVLSFYAGRDAISDLGFESAFVDWVGYPSKAAVPYVVSADKELADRIACEDMFRGYTISANGFYGPQGRELRIGLAEPGMNSRISSFRYAGGRIMNYEMEGSCISGLGRLLGHKCVTVCCVIAERVCERAAVDYVGLVRVLVEKVLEKV